MNVVPYHLPETCWDPTERIVPEGIVIHYISARYTKPDDPYDVDEIWRILAEYGFSYHFLIPREGGVLEFVPMPHRAFHAGVSEWDGTRDCNRWMAGVALAGMHETIFTDPQYGDLAQMTGELVTEYPTIRRRNLVGHEHVARPTGRKIDPGPAFDWDRYRRDSAGFFVPGNDRRPHLR